MKFARYVPKNKKTMTQQQRNHGRKIALENQRLMSKILGIQKSREIDTKTHMQQYKKHMQILKQKRPDNSQSPYGFTKSGTNSSNAGKTPVREAVALKTLSPRLQQPLEEMTLKDKITELSRLNEVYIKKKLDQIYSNN